LNRRVIRQRQQTHPNPPENGLHADVGLDARCLAGLGLPRRPLLQAYSILPEPFARPRARVAPRDLPSWRSWCNGQDRSERDPGRARTPPTGVGCVRTLGDRVVAGLLALRHRRRHAWGGFHMVHRWLVVQPATALEWCW